MTIDEMIAVLQAAKESSMKKSRQMARSAWRAVWRSILRGDELSPAIKTVANWYRSAKP